MVKQKIFAIWFIKHPNFGDALNPILIKYITGISPEHIQNSINNPSTTP